MPAALAVYTGQTGAPVPEPQPLRQLPSVDRLLRAPNLRTLPRQLVVRAAREVLQEARAGLVNGGWSASIEALPQLVEERVHASTRGALRGVINATGVVIHTNLGRAPLSSAALEAMAAVARGYSNLEY